MLILHCSDLHLGKTLHERDLREDQAHMLSRIVDCVAERRPAALVIAGDIYDRSIPQPEAIALFDGFLVALRRADSGLVILAVTGNHDSAARLSFASTLLSHSGIHIRTRPEDCSLPIRLERGGEILDLWALPFLAPGSFSGGWPASPRTDAAIRGAPGGRPGELPFDEEPPGAEAGRGPSASRGQAELFAEAISHIVPALDSRSANVLVAHCFARGGERSESERDFMGGAEQVDTGPLAAFDYVALGHLHRRQEAGLSARYSGSPLAYSFGEAGQGKGFLLVDVGRGMASEEFVPIKPLHRVVRLEGDFSSLCGGGNGRENREDYVEVRLTDGRVVLNPADALRGNFPFLLSVRQAAFEMAAPGGEVPEPLAGGEGIEADFHRFHAEMLGRPPDQADAEAFRELAREASIETP